MSKKNWPARLAAWCLVVSILCDVWVTPLHAADFTPAEIGGALEGATVETPGAYDLRSRSRDIGGTTDQFHFAHQQRTGNFDVQVRVERLEITDPFAQAGLVARSTLDPGAPFAGVFSSSALLGCLFESRATASAAATAVTPTMPFPVNYPAMHLRLRRVGSAFTGFGSLDGQSWQQLGTATVTMPANVFLGLGLASHDTNAVSRARFRDFGPATSSQVMNYRPEREPMGPSSRRTGLVFSEIMYNPAARADTNNLEYIEIFNAESIFLDLTGWRITGGVEYQFPAGFKIEAGQFAVIAADPAALAGEYGLQGVLGPFTGRLNNGGDTLQMLNAASAVRLEVSYEADGPWPVSADGAGHSLVLARPSYGEDDPRAWAASELIGGSPGEIDALRPSALKSVVINEYLAHTDDPVLDFIELYNASNAEVDISGSILTDDLSTNRFRVPAGTILPARGFVSYTQNDLGFSLSAEGEAVYFISPTEDRVLDEVKFAGQENGVSTGRAPDGSPDFARLSSPTPGSANNRRRIEDLVINEVMYHSITDEDDAQYVELHNRGNAAVDLSGWRFVDGIDFEFPEGARIAANGYAVVARDLGWLLERYPQLNTNNSFGNFDGQLSRSGERLALAKRDFVQLTNEFGVEYTNTIAIVVSEISYKDGGRWPETADGGGSSLELMDARADTRLAANWAASDETAKAPWTTVEVTGRLEMGGGNGAANRLQIIMQGAGECLVDDVELIPQGSTNILINGDFDTVTNTWRFFGNHRGSAIENIGVVPNQSGQNVLHVRAPGDGDTANNAIRGNLTRTFGTGTGTIRARVRWLSGWPEALFRIRGNWLELPARMEVPANLGTPGLANSRRVANGAPAIHSVSHYPPSPRASEPVLVTCRVSDPDGVAQPELRFRIDSSQTLTTILMRDDGLSGDLLAGDGLYSATLSARSANTLVAFRIEADDDAAVGDKAVFPTGAPARECLVRWGDEIPFGTMGHYHMWSTAATESARAANPDLDNTFRDATLAYGNTRVIYNVGFRDKGSPFHGGGGDFALTVPRDDLLLGIDDRVFASTGNGGSEGTGMKTDVAGWLGEQMAIPFLHNHFMRLYRNGNLVREVMLDMEQPNRYYAQSWFGGGGVKDDLFKIAIWFEFDDGNSSFSSTIATFERFLSNGLYKLARYRWNWQLRPSTETANDYSTLFNLITAANSSTDRTRTLPLIANLEEWMRVFAFHRVIGNWDSWTYNVGQNMYLYAPLGGRAALLPWDIDFVLGEGDGTSGPLFNSQDSTMGQLFNLPPYRRMLWRAYEDAANGPLVAANFQPQIEARRSAFAKNGITGLASPTSITSYMNGRRNYILGQIRTADAKGFAITSNGGADLTSADSSIVLAGFAPFAVATIEVNGVPFPVNWVNATNWQVTVPLGSRTNLLEITGKDLRGASVTNAADTITVTYTGGVPQPQDWVVINEIMYHAFDPDADFIELHNRHPSYAFDLSDFELRGVDFRFPPGSLIQPNGYLVIAENRAAFGAAYGPLIAILGPYQGSLQNNGETLRLVRPGPADTEDLVLDDVRYENTAPWPPLADGSGPSLQLIDAAQDNWRAGNWGATAINDANRATPGRANANRRLLEPFPFVWLNEIQPVNTGGASDNFGEREPWVELFNSGAASLDLAGFSLTDDPALPAKWQFPSGTRIDPGQYLVVWLDGEISESTPAAPHASFRASGTNGIIVLSRPQGGSPAAADYIRYAITSPANSFGSLADGEPRVRRMLYRPTPGSRNDPALPAANLVVNEWMAAAQSVIQDPADGHFEDWFELYNAGTNSVDLSGYLLADSRNPADPFTIPAGYVVGPKQFRLVWADGEPVQNAPGRDLHVNFSLSADGEEIVMLNPDREVVSAALFAEQTRGISEGRFPDGAAEPFALFNAPTPGQPNQAVFANQPPVISPIDSRSVTEGAQLSFRAVATDPDQPAQTLTFSLSNAPEGATINPQTGDFSWLTTERQGPGTYTITLRVTDSGLPRRAAAVSFGVTVTEFNSPPVLAEPPVLAIDEGLPFSYTVQAGDPDFPAQHLTFSLAGGSPPGLTIDPASGELAWVPAEEQGPGVYPVMVRAIDDGQPPLQAERTYTITVRDFNNLPVFAPIPSQSIDEEQPFSLQITARDPETPPAQLTYSLETAPEGLAIHPDTGLLTWTPPESAGPRDYNIVVKVSEPGGEPSATAGFLLGVHEINSAPVLDPLQMAIVRPGDFLLLTNRATDRDLPAQALQFSAAAPLPAGATLDPVSGVLLWQLSDDPPSGTNQITFRVTDNGSPALSAEQTVQIRVLVRERVVINEILHRPKAPLAEFIELHNLSAVNSADLSGWRLEGYNRLFPAGTVIPPSGFLCVARDLNSFRNAYGAGPALVANAVIAISPDGGLLRLIRPASLIGPEAVVDEVAFSLLPPWPGEAATNGASLQLIDPREDRRRLGNWAAGTGFVTNAPINLTPIGGAWRYWQQAAFPGANWNTLEFSDAAWPSGPALFYVEESEVPAPKATALTLGRISYYFRQRFNFPGTAASAALRISPVLDDGAVFHLNGQPFYRVGMPAGAIAQDTVANRTVGNAVYEGPFEIPISNLRQGENVLAVEAHQSGAGSSDIVFGAAIDLITTSPAVYSPGAPNPVSRDLPTIPPLFINEIMTVNTTGIIDNAGDREPWLELYNGGPTIISLANWSLTDNQNDLFKWAFPANAIVPAFGYLLVWLDGESGETTPASPHTWFRLTGFRGRMLLVNSSGGAPAIIDYLDYALPGANTSFGSQPDGHPISRQVLSSASPGAANPVDVPREVVLSGAAIPGGVLLSWTLPASQAYRLESREDLTGAPWQLLAQGTANGNPASFTDQPPAAARQRYYRLVLP